MEVVDNFSAGQDILHVAILIIDDLSHLFDQFVYFGFWAEYVVYSNTSLTGVSELCHADFIGSHMDRSVFGNDTRTLTT